MSVTSRTLPFSGAFASGTAARAAHAFPAAEPCGSPQRVGVRLDQLPLQQSAMVIDVAAGQGEDDADRVLRLTEIGFVPGEKVRVVAHGFPGREPVAVRIGHTTFALRGHEAALVWVQPEPAPPGRGRR